MDRSLCPEKAVYVRHCRAADRDLWRGLDRDDADRHLAAVNIPIVSVIWTYSGLDADDMSKRIIGVCERALPTTVNNIQYTESQSYSGVGVIKIHFQPNVQIDLAIAQVTALAQSLLRLMPTGILPPYVLKYDASSVPIVQVSLGGQGLSQTELYDLGQNFVRGQLATIKGAAVPLPYGGKQRSIMVDVEPVQLAANHLTASDLSLALSNQNLSRLRAPRRSATASTSLEPTAARARSRS